MATAIRNTFEPVILTAQYPRSHISIFVHVLSADGGAWICPFCLLENELRAHRRPFRRHQCLYSRPYSRRCRAIITGRFDFCRLPARCPSAGPERT